MCTAAVKNCLGLTGDADSTPSLVLIKPHESDGVYVEEQDRYLPYGHIGNAPRPRALVRCADSLRTQGANTLLIAPAGVQRGDEGKGKTRDSAVGDPDVAACHLGGNNVGYITAANGKKHGSYQAFLGTTHLDYALATGNGRAANFKAASEETDTPEVDGTIIKNSKTSGNVYATTLHYTDSDGVPEQKSGKKNTGIIKCGTGLRHQDKTVCTGSCTQDTSDEVSPCDKPEIVSVCANFESESTHNSFIHIADQTRDEHSFTVECSCFHTIEMSSSSNNTTDEGKDSSPEGVQVMSSDTDYGIHLHAMLLNRIVGGVTIGLGAGTKNADCASGATKVHTICAGLGFTFIESLHELEVGYMSIEEGHEHGAIIGCCCCRGRPDGFTVNHVLCANGSIDTVSIKSDASLVPDITKARAVHDADGECHISAFEYQACPEYVKFTHAESFGRKRDTIGRCSPDESLQEVQDHAVPTEDSVYICAMPTGAGVGCEQTTN